MVIEGRVQAEDKEGNDQADHFANEGVKLFGEVIIELGGRLASRHIAYAKFLQKLHDTFIESILKRNELVKQKKPSFQRQRRTDHQKAE